MDLDAGEGEAVSAVVQISAGTGPVEVRRFVGMLAEHLAGRCEAEGTAIREVVVRGDEAAPASVEIHVAGNMEWLRALAGTHALVARSPDRGKRARKRWYAGVRLCEAEGAGGGARTGTHGPGARPGARTGSGPRADSGGRAGSGAFVEVRRDEVAITAMRASGPGGQKVNKTSSAVRVHHAASGITVRVADERSQRDNVRVALARIGRILAGQATSRAAAEKAGRRMLHHRLERGSPTRTYEIDENGGLSPCEETCSR